MCLGMNLISQKLSFKITVYLTITLGFFNWFFIFGLDYFNFDYFIFIPILVFTNFAITFLILKRKLNPINQFTSLLKEIQLSSNKVNANFNNNEWLDLENEINNLVKKLNSDIYQIEELGKSRTQFLANVSHELKTPIFTIKGYIETLLDGGIDDSNVNRIFLEKIQSQIFRLETIFTDLIDITRIESGDLKLNFDWFNFNEIIQWIKESFEHLAKERGLNLSLPDSIDYEIFADKNRIQTVFSNLFANAINYSDSGTIRLSVKKEQNKLFIKVIDNGIGISPENQS